MKKLILLILLLAMAAANAIAARMYPAGGRVVDEQGQAVEYATVVLLRGGEQVAGMATDDDGRFELKVPTGEYTLSIQYLGFDPVLRQVRVEADNDLGDIVLKSSSTQIEGVVVKAQLIRREADRFGRRRGQRPGGDRQGRHRTAGARSGRMGGRREDLDQRQERFEGVRQRPRAAHGTGAAADLPAFAARRRHPENRGRAHDPARTTMRMRRAASSG